MPPSRRPYWQEALPPGRAQPSLDIAPEAERRTPDNNRVWLRRVRGRLLTGRFQGLVATLPQEPITAAMEQEIEGEIKAGRRAERRKAAR
jgi:hypothetical protein